MTFWSAFFMFFHGVDVLKPYVSPSAVNTRWKYSPRAPDQGAMAPSSIDRSGLGTTSSGSTSYLVPSPAQVAHAPYGELNEKFRGASSSKLRPHTGQARC